MSYYDELGVLIRGQRTAWLDETGDGQPTMHVRTTWLRVGASGTPARDPDPDEHVTPLHGSALTLARELADHDGMLLGEHVEAICARLVKERS